MSKINEEPIFIVGFPRSGTTYLQSLICTQTNIVSFPETHFFTNGVGHYKSDEKLDKTKFNELVEVVESLNDIKLDNTFIDACDKEILKNEGIAQKLVFDHLISQHLLGIKEDVLPGNRWIEKTPVNALYMDKIKSYYPNAKFIAIVRNPVDAIDSYYNKLVAYRQPIHDLAAYWNRIDDAILSFKKHNPSFIKVVQYEHLMENRNLVIKDIIDFIDEDFQVELLDNYASEAAKLVRKDETWKIDNTNNEKYIGRGKSTISKKYILQIQHILQDKLKVYKYPIRHKILFSLYSFIKKRSK